MSKKLAVKVRNRYLLYETLTRKMLGKNLGAVGHPTVSSTEEEPNIAKTLSVVANWEFPLIQLDVRTVIDLKKQGKIRAAFKVDIPEEDFLDSFIKMNTFSVRLASNVERSRASKEREDIISFFTNK